MEVCRCAACGAHEVVVPRIEELHEALAMAVEEQEARSSGAEVRFLRKCLGYLGADFAGLIGVSHAAAGLAVGRREARPSRDERDQGSVAS